MQATHRVGWGLVLELVLEGAVWPGALGQGLCSPSGQTGWAFGG